MLVDVVPQIKQAFPDVKIFGSENMLNMEGASNNYQFFYHNNLKQNQDAANQIDILAVHGYVDGVAPNTGSELVERWDNHYQQFTVPMNKTTWMTETSGYEEQWEGTGDKPGAFGLGLDIHTALHNGNISGWVWWQGSAGNGSSAEIGEFDLMKGVNTGKKYAVSKHYYRFIRPGAERIAAATSKNSIFTTAYKHQTNGTQTIVVINAGDTDEAVILQGNSLPSSYEIYRTNATTENCDLIKTYTTGDTSLFFLPAKSMITLQAGGNPL